MRLAFVLLSAAVLAHPAAAQGGPALSPAAQALLAKIDAREGEIAEVASALWDYAEVGYKEEKSSGLLKDRLRAEGFSVQEGVAGIPTAFVATWGSGEPVIALLAEMDALPGVSQDAVPERAPLKGRLSGHACGHHLFGAGSTSAAIAVKTWLERNRRGGTIRLYGTPAEEGGYIALNPETGTTTQGETVEEAIANLQEATALYLSEFPIQAVGHPLVTTFSVPAHA